jgi:hypothetical protein
MYASSPVMDPSACSCSLHITHGCVSAAQP